MLSGKKKFQLAGGFATLLCFAAAVGCSGFFVDPTLNSLAISPASFSLQRVGQTQQLTATGTFNDGSTQNLTGSSTWASSDAAVAKVSGTGLVTAETSTSGSATITVTHNSKAGAVSGTATATIGTSTGTITVTCTQGTSISLSGNGGSGSAVTFTADQNGTDVSSQAAWSSTSSSIINIASNSGGSGTLGGSTGTVTITATVSGTSGSVQITVTP